MSDRAPLQETIALLKATLDSTHDAILVVDLEQRIIFYNRRYLEMFGFTAERARPAADSTWSSNGCERACRTKTW